LPPCTRLRLSLGGFRLAPGDLRRDGGLARLFLLPGLPFGSRFVLGLVGVRVRQMHGEVQHLEPAMRTPHRLRGALDRPPTFARDIGASSDTRRARHDRPKTRGVENACPCALEAIRIGAAAAAGALGWMVGLDGHQPLLMSVLPVCPGGLGSLWVV
jgi:hypothetical protein